MSTESYACSGSVTGDVTGLTSKTPNKTALCYAVTAPAPSCGLGGPGDARRPRSEDPEQTPVPLTKSELI